MLRNSCSDKRDPAKDQLYYQNFKPHGILVNRWENVVAMLHSGLKTRKSRRCLFIFSYWLVCLLCQGVDVFSPKTYNRTREILQLEQLLW